MKKQMIAIGVMFCFVSGCVYLENRARDFSDIITLSVEDQNIGCSARFILPWGLCYARGEGFGLREGWIGRYEYTEKEAMLFPYGGLFELEFTPEHDYRDKSYSLYWLDRGDGPFWFQCLNFQVMLGFLYGVRAGLNMGEAVDFMLGWTTLDILTDDKSMFSRPETAQRSTPVVTNSITPSVGKDLPSAVLPRR